MTAICIGGSKESYSRKADRPKQTMAFDTKSNFIVAISQMFSTSLVSKLARKNRLNAVFAYATGISISKPSGWLSAVQSNCKAAHGGKKAYVEKKLSTILLQQRLLPIHAAIICMDNLDGIKALLSAFPGGVKSVGKIEALYLKCYEW